jgi:hypothetical protein
MECKGLIEWTKKIERSQGASRAATVIDFAAKCMTQVSQELRSVHKQFTGGDLPNLARYKKHLQVIEALLEVASTEGLSPVLRALRLIAKINDTVLYRPELWNEMKHTIQEYQPGSLKSLPDVAWHLRDRARRFGRRVDGRTVSRTLLVKGLEFDHVIVLNADDLDAKNLYVAMTRGTQSLTVLSADPVIVRSVSDDKQRPPTVDVQCLLPGIPAPSQAKQPVRRRKNEVALDR